MSQVDNNKNPSAGKRARTDGGRREDDWTCPSCGNVNFSFRTTCNMRNCTQPRPADHNSSKFAGKPFQPGSLYTSSAGYMSSPPPPPPPPPPSMYLLPSFFGGSTLPPYGLRYPSSSAYPYNYGSRLSIGSPYGPMHMSGTPPYSGGSMLGTGGMYGMPPMVDRYHAGLPIGCGPTPMGARPALFPHESSQKKPSDNEHNDWTCPNCGNNNFSFRTVCNMRNCNTPRPGTEHIEILQASNSEPLKGSKPKMPEGSWKCEKCNNINYPFRTKCNRQNCGAERPAGTQKQVAVEDNQ